MRRSAVAVVAGLAWAALIVTWALATPHGATKGADRILVGVWCVVEEVGRCSPPFLAGGADTRFVPAAIVREVCVRDAPERSAACSRSATDGLGGQVEVPLRLAAWLADLPETPTGRPHRYLRIQTTLVDDDVRASIVRIRSLNAGLAVLLPLVAFAIAPLPARRAMIASGATLVPLGLVLLGSVDSSAWTIVGALLVGPMAFVCAGRGPTLRRAAAGLVGLTGALLLVTPMGAPPFRTGLFLGLTVAAVVTAQLLGCRRGSWDRRSIAGALVILTAVSSLLRTFLPSPLWTHVVPVRRLLEDPAAIPRALGDVVGRGSGIDPEMALMPAGVSIVLLLALLILLLSGLRSMDWPGRALVASVSLAGLIHLLYVTHLEGFAIDDALFGGRHFLPLIIIIVAIATSFADPSGPLLGQASARALAVAVTLAHAVALRVHLAGSVASGASRSGRFTDIEWWWSLPLGPDVVWVIGAASLALLAALASSTLAASTSTRTSARGVR